MKYIEINISIYQEQFDWPHLKVYIWIPELWVKAKRTVGKGLLLCIRTACKTNGHQGDWFSVFVSLFVLFFFFFVLIESFRLSTPLAIRSDVVSFRFCRTAVLTCFKCVTWRRRRKKKKAHTIKKHLYSWGREEWVRGENSCFSVESLEEKMSVFWTITTFQSVF